MKKLIYTLFLTSTFITKAQEIEKITINGVIDTYYTTNLSTSQRGTQGVLSDVPANGFGIGMANTILSYEKGKAGVVADLAYGPRANALNMYKGAINQLYVYHNVSENIKFTLGQFNTFFGYELISPSENFNYSASYLFNAGPFSHTGLKLDYKESEDLSFMLAITNPHSEISGANLTDDYQVGLQVGYKKQYLNLVYGADGSSNNDSVFIDYTGGFDFSKTLYLGINVAYNNCKSLKSGYQGVALYLQNKFSQRLSIGIRPEHYKVNTGNLYSDQSAFTLSSNIEITENLKLITELRYDTSNNMVFYGKKNITGLTIASVYNF